MPETPSHTRAWKKQKTRETLLQAAFDLFCEQGLAATRTIDVARRAGVSHGAVFLHFPTRDDLVAEVVGGTTKRIAERIAHLTEREGTTTRDVLQAHLAGIAEHEDFYARLVAESPLLRPYARSTLLGIQAVVSHHLGAVVRREQAEGRLKAVPLPLLFNTWLGLVHYYLVNRDLFAPGESVIERHGQTLVEHYLGLLGP
jgi:AcrR family transcriptional regulator